MTYFMLLHKVCIYLYFFVCFFFVRVFSYFESIELEKQTEENINIMNDKTNLTVLKFCHNYS